MIRVATRWLLTLFTCVCLLQGGFVQLSLADDPVVLRARVKALEKSLKKLEEKLKTLKTENAMLRGLREEADVGIPEIPSASRKRTGTEPSASEDRIRGIRNERVNKEGKAVLAKRREEFERKAKEQLAEIVEQRDSALAYQAELMKGADAERKTEVRKKIKDIKRRAAQNMRQPRARSEAWAYLNASVKYRQWATVVSHVREIFVKKRYGIPERWFLAGSGRNYDGMWYVVLTDSHIPPNVRIRIARMIIGAMPKFSQAYLLNRFGGFVEATAEVPGANNGVLLRLALSNYKKSVKIDPEQPLVWERIRLLEPAIAKGDEREKRTKTEGQGRIPAQAYRKDYNVLRVLLRKKMNSLKSENETSAQVTLRLRRFHQWATSEFVGKSIEWMCVVKDLEIRRDARGKDRVYADFTITSEEGTERFGGLTTLPADQIANIGRRTRAKLCTVIEEIRAYGNGGIDIRIKRPVNIQIIKEMEERKSKNTASR